MEVNENKKVLTVSFAAINPVVENLNITPDETRVPGKDYVFWGKKNDYPDFLRSLRRGASTLKSVINGCCDYVVGDRVTCVLPYDSKAMNKDGKTPRDFIWDLAQNEFTYGGFAFEVIRSEEGDIVEVYPLDLAFLRSNKECTVFYYSEDWTKKFGKKNDITLPKFNHDAREVKESVVYVKNVDYMIYPECPWEGSLIAAQLEMQIDQYHRNSMNNGFTASYIVNFNNGVPEDQVKEEIEKAFMKKFSGFQNAGRIMFSWNNSRESMTTVQELKASDFSDKYDALAKRSRQQIFTAFRANPNLFGIPTENLGFSSEEYDSAFKLFNRTVIQPVQQKIIAAMQAVYPFNVTITPFSLAGDTEGTEKSEE